MKAWIARILISAVLLICIIAGSLFWLGTSNLKKSLPILDGERPIEGLIQKVRIERDALGIPTIYAYNPLDQARAFGYLHAQERFFQMDLYRRLAAGELAEMIPQALENDKKARVHQFRQRAETVVRNLNPSEQRILKAYSEGVNSGLADLSSNPFEYHLLGVDPAPWTEADSILCAVSMTMALQDTEVMTDRVRGQFANTVPEELFDFFYRNGTRWEATQDGSIREIIEPPSEPIWQAITQQWPANPESPDWMPEPTQKGDGYPRETPRNGSNNWAIRPSARAANPAAWVANDMHLGLRIPNTWYRATVFETSSNAEPIEVSGASLPGFPAVIVGSNGKVAWGLTNSNADTEDAVILVEAPSDSTQYLTSEGLQSYVQEEEIIRVKDAEPVSLIVEKTEFGPVIGENAEGQKIALQWVAHQPWSIDLQLLNLAKASSTQEVLDIAASAKSPALSLVAGDRDGNIGWTLIGSIPERNTDSLQLRPLESTDPQAAWVGKLPASKMSRIVNPESGFITTANARIVGGEDLAIMGDSGYLHGSRQWLIQRELSLISRPTLENMIDIQMNIEGVALYPWQALIRWAYSPTRGSLGPDEAALIEQVNAWSGRAEAKSVGYRIIRQFRDMMLDRLYARIWGPILSKDASIYYNRSYARLGIPMEEPMLRILETRPEFLADPYYMSWESEMRAVLSQIIEDAKVAPSGLYEYRWGQVNQSEIAHPMAPSVPFLGKHLAMESVELDGDQFTPNATAPKHGPSQRMIVQVGREREGRFSMPGGQSGHPLSDYFDAGHDAWISGIETPLRPGETVHKLTLTPVR